MLSIKVLGSGCRNCQKVEAHTRQALAVLPLADGYEIEHVRDPLAISDYVLRTPGLVINETVVSEGRVPAIDEITRWLERALAAES